MSKKSGRINAFAVQAVARRGRDDERAGHAHRPAAAQAREAAQ